jgi:transcriptional regulator with XRE-family HTH domain
MAVNDETEVAKDAPYRDFALKLAEGMRKSGVTAKDVELECKVNDETVRLWRRGKRMPRDKSLKRLASMIGVKPSDLRFNENAPSSTMPALTGEHVTDEDELALLRAYRALKKDWAKRALRARAVELLEQFGEKGVTNPWAGTQ